MQTTEQDVIQLTQRAARQVSRIRSESGITDDKLLRIGVKGGGCSGLSYILDFDNPQEMDLQLNINGVDLIIDKRHALYLDGTVLDFKDGLDARGFVFENPKASTTCGCGSSFST